MDIKITKKRILNVLNYEWVKAIAYIVAIILLWSLLFTSLGTRLTDGQQFYMVTYEGVYTKSADATVSFLSEMKNGKSGINGDSVLSYDVYQTKETPISALGSYSAINMFDIRLSVNEGDIMVLPDKAVEYNPTDNETLTDFQYFVNNGKLESIEKLLSDAYDYTVGNGFIEETDSGYTVNDKKIENYFKDERIKSARNYRRTYISDEVINEGVKNEIKRIETVYLNYKTVKSGIEKANSVDKGFLTYKTPSYVTKEGEIISKEEGAYGIDLGKLNEGYQDKDVKDLWYVLDEDGNPTEKGLILAVIELTSVQPELQYESLGVIAYLIRNYSNYAN